MVENQLLRLGILLVLICVASAGLVHLGQRYVYAGPLLGYALGGAVIAVLLASYKALPID